MSERIKSVQVKRTSSPYYHEHLALIVNADIVRAGEAVSDTSQHKPHGSPEAILECGYQIVRQMEELLRLAQGAILCRHE